MAAAETRRVQNQRICYVSGGAATGRVVLTFPDTATAAEVQGFLLSLYEQTQTELASELEAR